VAVARAFPVAVQPGRALRAFATKVLDNPVEVFLAVVINNFFAGLDCLSRPDPNTIAGGDDCLSVWRARVIRVTREVIAPAAVNRPFLGHAEEVLAIALVDDLVRHAWAGVFDDLFSFGNASGSEQPEAGG